MSADEQFTDADLAEIVRVYERGEFPVITSRWVVALVREVQRARAAGGVQPAPAERAWTEAEIRAAFRGALFYSAPDTGGRLVFGYADPHVYLDTDPYLPKAEDGLLIALRAAGSGSADQPPAEVWCAGHNDGTAHPFSGHMTCHECGAVNWEACYHAVADSVQDDELSAGASTDGAGTPGAHDCARLGCPLVDGRRMHVEPDRTTRQVLADLANDAQDMGTYGGPLHTCPYGCECPEHNPARDPSCGLCHPHTATSRCAGGPDA